MEPTTEKTYFCNRGHGELYAHETQNDGEQRWCIACFQHKNEDTRVVALVLTPQQIATLAAALAPTRHEQAQAMGVSTAQLGRYLVDGVSYKCSGAIKAHLWALARERGVL